LHRDERGRVLAEIAEANAAGRGLRLEYRLIARDGRQLRFRDEAVAERSADGTIVAWHGYMLDITDRHQAEIEARRSEVLLDSIVRSLPGALWVKDAREFRYVRVSRVFEEVIGYLEPEVLGRDDYELFPDHAAAFRDEDIRTLAQGRLDIPAHPVKAANGSVLWLQTIKVAIRDTDGMPCYILGYARDVTESRAAEDALRRSDERFRSLLANIPGAVYRCRNDKVWTMEFLSEGIEDIVGYPASDFLGDAKRDYLSVIHPEDRQFVEDAIAAALERREPFGVEYRVVDAAGNAR